MPSIQVSPLVDASGRWVAAASGQRLLPGRISATAAAAAAAHAAHRMEDGAKVTEAQWWDYYQMNQRP
jgi:hypothetical protein